jgi:hypothetical protein
MYKGCAPRISELAVAGRKRHQVRSVDNQQQSNKKNSSNLSNIGQKRLTLLKMENSIDIEKTWRSMLISSSDLSVSGIS